VSQSDIISEPAIDEQSDYSMSEAKFNNSIFSDSYLAILSGPGEMSQIDWSKAEIGK
jgi:hypothetical protein